MKGNFFKSAGYFFADWRAIGSVLLFFLCAIGSIILLSKKQVKKSKTTGQIITVSPSPANLCTKVQDVYTSNNQPVVLNEYECTFTARYTIDSTSYTHKFTSRSQTEYKTGDSISVYYDPNNIDDVSLTDGIDARHIFGYFLLTLAVIFFFAELGALFWLYAVNKDDTIAKATGVLGTVDVGLDALKDVTS